VFEEGRNPEKQAGRPSTILRMNPNVVSVIAVDLRLPEAYVALTDLNGKILYSDTETLAVVDPKQSVQQLLSLIQHVWYSCPAAPPVRAIVIGAPSIVEPNTGFVEWAPSLGWTGMPLGQIISEEFTLAVRVENDVNLAALGEYWKGASPQGTQNMVFVSVGTGIGAGIIINGELYHGATSAAGEVGYFINDLETLRDQAGKVGHIESRVARDGTLRRASLIAQRYPASQLAELINHKGQDIRVRDIFALASERDPAALVVFNETVDLLTVVITNLAVVLDPENVVLGGPSEWKWDMLAEAINKRVGSSLLRPINLQPSKLGRNALVLGAAYLAIRLDGVIPNCPY
jgi:glucokinase